MRHTSHSSTLILAHSSRHIFPAAKECGHKNSNIIERQAKSNKLFHKIKFNFKLVKLYSTYYVLHSNILFCVKVIMPKFGCRKSSLQITSELCQSNEPIYGIQLNLQAK